MGLTEGRGGPSPHGDREGRHRPRLGLLRLPAREFVIRESMDMIEILATTFLRTVATTHDIHRTPVWIASPAELFDHL